MSFYNSRTLCLKSTAFTRDRSTLCAYPEENQKFEKEGV